MKFLGSARMFAGAGPRKSAPASSRYMQTMNFGSLAQNINMQVVLWGKELLRFIVIYEFLVNGFTTILYGEICTQWECKGSKAYDCQPISQEFMLIGITMNLKDSFYLKRLSVC